jgi:hypothetical protein
MGIVRMKIHLGRCYWCKVFPFQSVPALDKPLAGGDAIVVAVSLIEIQTGRRCAVCYVLCVEPTSR